MSSDTSNVGKDMAREFSKAGPPFWMAYDGWALRGMDPRGFIQELLLPTDRRFLPLLQILVIPEYQPTLLDEFPAGQHEEELSLKRYLDGLMTL